MYSASCRGFPASTRLPRRLCVPAAARLILGARVPGTPQVKYPDVGSSSAYYVVLTRRLLSTASAARPSADGPSLTNA
jgi:hypothetical protein